MGIKVVGIQGFLNTPGWLADRVVFSGKDLQVELHRDRRLAMRCPCCGSRLMPSRTQSHRVRDIGLGVVSLFTRKRDALPAAAAAR